MISLTESQITIYWLLYISMKLLIVIIRLMLSLSLCPKVITLSGFRCILFTLSPTSWLPRSQPRGRHIPTRKPRRRSRRRRPCQRRLAGTRCSCSGRSRDTRCWRSCWSGWRCRMTSSLWEKKNISIELYLMIFQTKWQRDRETERQRDRETERQKNRETER